MSKEIKEQQEEMEKETAEVSTSVEAPMGFEEDAAEDLIIPRVKIVQTLSPEAKERKADEGDIINSLTTEKLNGKSFVPVFMFKNNILWKPRSAGGGIQCMARDGKIGRASDDDTLLCSVCRKNEFDNSKSGADAIPTCTKYINFFGFFEGERVPIILSFAKTNYNEGKKLYSVAKIMMQNMWNFGYPLNAKKMAKNGNEWYIIAPGAGSKTDDEDREFGLRLFKEFRNINELKFDVEDAVTSDTTSSAAATEAEF